MKLKFRDAVDTKNPFYAYMVESNITVTRLERKKGTMEMIRQPDEENYSLSIILTETETVHDFTQRCCCMERLVSTKMCDNCTQYKHRKSAQHPSIRRYTVSPIECRPPSPKTV